VRAAHHLSSRRGLFPSARASVGEVKCPVDTYSDTQAASSADTCQPCMLNASAVEGSVALQQCTCDPGVAKAGALCVACPAGSVQDGSDDGKE